ncbi:hypothetical protein GGF32_009559 [Allomyces javanicus]|nr:hypothetical protein GGF32_009559 [Allomyces javanicus]
MPTQQASASDSPASGTGPSDAPSLAVPASIAAPLPAGNNFSDLPLAVQQALIHLDTLVLDAVPALRANEYLDQRRTILQALLNAQTLSTASLAPARHARGDSLSHRSGINDGSPSGSEVDSAAPSPRTEPVHTAVTDVEVAPMAKDGARRRTWVVEYDDAESVDAARAATPVPPVPPSSAAVSAANKRLSVLQDVDEWGNMKRRSLFDQTSLDDAPALPTDTSTANANFPASLLPFKGRQQPPTDIRALPTWIDETLGASMQSASSLLTLVLARARNTPTTSAYRVLDPSGAELGHISWGQLLQKAEHEARLLTARLRDMPAGPERDHVLLVYARSELMELVVATVATWLAGRTPVPVVVPAAVGASPMTAHGIMGVSDDDAIELGLVMRHARATVALSTESTSRAIHADAAARGLVVPPLEWWDTFALPASLPDGVEPLCYDVPASRAAYVEFAWNAAGDMQGLVVPHGAVVAHCASLQAMMQLTSRDVWMTHLETRQGLGWHMVLMAMFAGITVVVAPTNLMDVGALWLTLLARHGASVTALTASCIQRLSVQATAAAGAPPVAEMAALRLVLIDEPVLRPAVVNSARSKLAAHLSNDQVASIFRPVCSVPELGGLVLAMCDLLDDACVIDQNGLAQMLLDRASLHKQEVVLIENDDDGAGVVTHTPPGAIPVVAAGLPAVGASIAIVSRTAPRVLVPPNQPGEIYLATSAATGMTYFGATQQQQMATFHQRPLLINDDDTMAPAATEFVRTGYIGCVIDGNVLVVLGRCHDTLLDPSTGVAHLPGDIATSVQNLLKGIDACCIVGIPNDAGLCLPVVALETARPAQEQSSVATSALTLIQDIHNLKCIAVICCGPGGLPRTRPNGRIVPAVVLKALPHLSPTWVSIHTHAVPSRPPQATATAGLPDRSADLHIAAVARPAVTETKYRSISDMLVARADKSSDRDRDAYLVVDANGQVVKSYTWRKFAGKVAALVSILNKKGIRAGDHVVLLYSHSLDYVIACHACIYAGIVAIPLPPPDVNRLQEDVPALLATCHDFNAQAILCNSIVEDLVRSKPFLTAVKRHMAAVAMAGVKLALPSVQNTSRIPKSSKTLGADGMQLDAVYVANREIPAVLQAYFDADMVRTVVKLSHPHLLEQAQYIAQALQLPTSSSSDQALLSCVRTYAGFGFLYSVALGVFTGLPTVLLPPFEFSSAPQVLFHLLDRYKVRDTYVTWPMLEYMVDATGMPPDQFAACMPGVRHLLVAQDRLANLPVPPGTVLPPALRPTLARPGNAMITGAGADADTGAATHPVSISLAALRHGLVDVRSHPRNETVTVLDVGAPAPGTTVVVADPQNPDAGPVPANVVGELWIASPANADGIVHAPAAVPIGAADPGATMRGMPGFPPAQVFYRTGEMGFVHDTRVYVLGATRDTFVMRGKEGEAEGTLLYFAQDVEAAVEACHPVVVPDGAVAFTVPGADGADRLVLVVEVDPAAVVPGLPHVLASIPVICLTLYLQHWVTVDTIVFLQHGMLARSRLFEKQRAKIRDAYLKGNLPSLHVFHMA